MKHLFHMTSCPQKTPARGLPDGAFTGNGDLNVILSGAPDRIRLYIAKADFWKATEGDRSDGGLAPISVLEILLPHFADSPFSATQDMDGGYLTMHMEAAHSVGDLSVCVAEGENDILLTLRVTCPGISTSFELLPLTDCGAVCESTASETLQTTERRFVGDDCVYPTSAMAALRIVSRKKEGRSLTVRAVVSVCTNHDSANYKNQAVHAALCMDDARFDRLLAAHDRAFRAFWAKSGVSLPDEEIERGWYAGLYALFCCSRNTRFAPGLWGAFATSDRMPWHGDYHLNYNFQAPYYAVVGSNHPELTEGYHRAILDFVPYGREFAREFLGCRGVYFPVGIGPLGLDTSRYIGTKEHGRLFLGQKSNASFCAVIMAMQWYGTRDLSYAEKTAYPFLLELADFWEDYLVKEDGRYIAYNDAIHEVEFYSSVDFMPKHQDEVNNITTVALIRCIMRCLLDMRAALGVDEARVPVWEDILANMGPIPTYEKDGTPYLRATEYGIQDTYLALQLVYPANELRYDSDPRLWEATRNTFRKTANWESENQICAVYPTAVRLGIDADEIIARMKAALSHRQMPNGLLTCIGGGLENCAAIPGMVQEMLLQSWDGVLRFFANCPWDTASFRGLRAVGAFVVSGKRENGVISAEIFSEKGQPLTVASPGNDYCLQKDGKAYRFTGDTLTIETAPNDRIFLLPSEETA